MCSISSVTALPSADNSLFYRQEMQAQSQMAHGSAISTAASAGPQLAVTAHGDGGGWVKVLKAGEAVVMRVE